MKNLILTTLSDSRFKDFSSRPEVDVFLDSVKRVPNADLLVISDVLNRPLPYMPCPISENIMIDRWLFFYQILCSASYSHVLITDSRDVYFQDNPFKYATEQVILSGEGVPHKESEWNTAFQKRNLESLELSFDIADWPVVNGGIVLGPVRKVRDYCLLVYTNARKNITDTDQPVIGLLWNTLLRHNPDFALAEPGTSALCVTGDTLKEQKLAAPIFFEKGIVLNSSRVPYALFHQWDRTIYRDEILRMHNQPA